MALLLAKMLSKIQLYIGLLILVFACNKKTETIHSNKGNIFSYNSQSSIPKKDFGILNTSNASLTFKLYTPTQGMRTNQAAFDRDGNYFITKWLGNANSADHLYRINIRTGAVDSLRYLDFYNGAIILPVSLSTYNSVTNKLYLWQPGKWFSVNIQEQQKTFNKTDSFTTVQNAISSTADPEKPLIYFSNGSRIYSLDVLTKVQTVLLYDSLKSFEGIRFNPNDGKIWGIKKNMQSGDDSIFNFNPVTKAYKTPVKVDSPHDDFFSAALDPCANEYIWINNKNGQHQLCVLNMETLAGRIVPTEQIQGMIWVGE
jgi:hypothetical protein